MNWLILVFIGFTTPPGGDAIFQKHQAGPRVPATYTSAPIPIPTGQRVEQTTTVVIYQSGHHEVSVTANRPDPTTMFWRGKQRYAQP
jgi:hypothetical protein